jgi:hypothetical protein
LDQHREDLENKIKFQRDRRLHDFQ